MADDDSNSLEGPSTSSSVIETNALEATSGVAMTPEEKAAKQAAAPKVSFIRKFSRRFNIYLLLFILVLVISGSVVVITALQSRNVQEPKIATQAIPTDTLKQLAKSDATVGDPKQVLNVQSNAVFAGKVLIRDSLDVAGQIHVNGSLNLPGITVSGDSTFDQVQINKTLNIGGDTSVLGQLNVKKNMSVSGTGTFGGTVTAPQIATSILQILGDLTITSHFIVGGSTPNRSNGGALGGGGTSSVSGSDTAGSININTGSGPVAGCFITVNFAGRYNSTPRIIITPVGSAAGAIDYYVTRTSTNFSVCSANTPPASSNFGFDYLVIG